MIDDDLIRTEPQKGTWAKTKHTGISEGDSISESNRDVFIYPSAKQPEYPEIVKYHVAENSYQGLVSDLFSKGFRPVYTHGYTFVNRTYFNVIFRPTAGLLWEARHGLNKSAYQDQYNLWVTEKGYRIAHLTIYESQNTNVYAVLFEKTSGPVQKPFYGLTEGTA